MLLPLVGSFLDGNSELDSEFITVKNNQEKFYSQHSDKVLRGHEISTRCVLENRNKQNELKIVLRIGCPTRFVELGCNLRDV